MQSLNDEHRRVGTRIATARREAGMTQRQLARELGVTTRSIQNYEAGAVIPYRHLRRIETLTRRRPGWLLAVNPERDDMGDTLARLERALADHQRLLQEHLETVRQQTELLRVQQEMARRRRG
jgi:transcriptional regulator with XRE-family HTH domain